MTGHITLRGKAHLLSARAQRRDGYGRIGWAKGGRPGFGNVATRCIGQHSQRPDIRVLALIGGHALGGVTLHMFDRAEILGRCLFDVFHRHIVLEIEPGAALARHGPEGVQSAVFVIRLRQGEWRCFQAQILQRLFNSELSGFQASFGREHTQRATRHVQSRHHVGHWHKGVDFRVPDRAAVHVASQVQCRIPAACDGKTVYCDSFGRATRGPDGDAMQPVPPTGVGHNSTFMDRHTNLGRLSFARIDDRGHIHTAARQIARSAIDVIAIAKDGHALARGYAIAMQIGPHCACRHHAGAVIVAKGNRAFQCARTKQRAFGRDPPETLTRRIAGISDMASHPFKSSINATIICPSHCRARHEADIGHGAQLRYDIGHPFKGWFAANGFGLRQQPPTRHRVFIGKDHIRACPTCLQGSYQT